MKQYKGSGFSRSIANTGFYTVIVCCLLALGAAGWFAVSKYNDIKSQSDKKPDTSNTESYSSETTPYSSNEDTAPRAEATPNTDVKNEVSDVPYSEEVQNEATDIPEELRSYVMPILGNISKGYSDTALQYSETYGDMRLHEGVDIICESGSEIVAAGAGTVSDVVDDAALGKTIIIDHGDGITAKYCGFESNFVTKGDIVSAGNPIGVVGVIPSECADKTHIHIEVIKDGKTISPLAAFGLE